MKLRLAVVSALIGAGALAAGAAQARDADVQWSVTIGTPGYGVAVPAYPAPVVVRPAPVYGVAVPAPAMPVYVPHRGHRHARYREPTRWDIDGDGIPNRYDRLYNPAWDRDGDGIPNRYERGFYRDHDRDGAPNRWDRFDHDPWRR